MNSSYANLIGAGITSIIILGIIIIIITTTTINTKIHQNSLFCLNLIIIIIIATIKISSIVSKMGVSWTVLENLSFYNSRF
jgi:hypothetical protein